MCQKHFRNNCIKNVNIDNCTMNVIPEPLGIKNLDELTCL